MFNMLQFCDTLKTFKHKSTRKGTNLMPLTADDWDDAPKKKKAKKPKRAKKKKRHDEFEDDSFDSGIDSRISDDYDDDEESGLPIKLLVTIVSIAAALALVAGGIYAFKDDIAGLFKDDKSTSAARDPEAGSGEINADDSENSPAAVPAEPANGAEVAKSINAAYTATGAIHTKGTSYYDGKKVGFDTTWLSDRSTGHGTITVDGNTAEVRVYKDFDGSNGKEKRNGILVHNNTGVLNDLLGHKVPFSEWVLVNAETELSHIFPSAMLSAEKANVAPEVSTDKGVTTAGETIITQNEGKISHITAPGVDYDIQSIDPGEIIPLPSGFALKGKIERDDAAGTWRNFKYT